MVGREPVEGGGEDRGVEVVEASEELLAVAVTGQHPAQCGGQGGPGVAVPELVEGVGEVGRGVAGGGHGGDGGDDGLPPGEVAVDGVLRGLVGQGCCGGQQVGQGLVGGVGVGAQGGDKVAEADAVAGVD